MTTDTQFEIGDDVTFPCVWQEREYEFAGRIVALRAAKAVVEFTVVGVQKSMRRNVSYADLIRRADG